MIFALLLQPLSLAVSEDASKTYDSLKRAESDMAQMLSDGLSATRYNDTLLLAEQLYSAQVALEKSGGKPLYSIIDEKISELNGIKQKAYKSLDEIKALNATISQVEGVDMEPAAEIYQQALNEFNSERYEESLKLVDGAYKKISELDAMQTKVKAFYEATSKNIIDFFRDNWEEILISAAAIAAAILLAYNRMARRLIKRKIENLETRKESIRNLIAKAQKEYFDEGKISESSYFIKTKKYAELIRDINRQIPLFKEELSKKEKFKSVRGLHEKGSKRKKQGKQESKRIG